MKYGQVRGVAKPVSRLVLGTMSLSASEKEQSFSLLDAAYATGINTFDAAHVYGGGEAERALGAWVGERGLRGSVVVLDKGCHPGGGRMRVTPSDLTADLSESLERLRFDYVDIYMLHRDDPAVDVGPIVETLNEHLAAGRMRAFGASNWRHERIEEANEYAAKRGLAPFAAGSPNYGLAEQVEDPWGPGCVSISGPGGAEARAWYARTRTAVFAYSSLGRGLFSGRVDRGNFPAAVDGACLKAYCHEVNFRRLDRVRTLAAEKGVAVPQLALAYVLNQPLDVFALVGAATPEECEQDAAAVDIALAPGETAWLDLGGEDR